MKYQVATPFFSLVVMPGKYLCHKSELVAIATATNKLITKSIEKTFELLLRLISHCLDISIFVVEV